MHQICIRVWNVHKQLIGSTYTSKEDHEDISVPSVNMRGRQLQESSNIYLNTLNLFVYPSASSSTIDDPPCEEDGESGGTTAPHSILPVSFDISLS